MAAENDMELLRRYRENGSEEAFAELVARHVNLVYSAALRHTQNAAHAEEITQAVFVILAQKAGALRADTVLEGWLYQTARLTSLTFARGERRRAFREQEAYMQSTVPDPDDAAVWNQLAPLLDEAMARLGSKDREAVVLRYFKAKDVREVAAALKVTESAAQRRVHRALEKLHRYFEKRGVTSSAASIAAAISAHSIQEAPGVVAKSAAAAAIAKGAASGTSTLTLIKGALKVMAWTKAKTAIVAAVVIFAAGTAMVVVDHVASGSGADRHHVFADGTVLALNRVVVDSKADFFHGTETAKWLGNLVPSNGMHRLGLNLNRRTELNFDSDGKSWLVAEFKVSGLNATNSPFVKPAFFREFRYVIYGEGGGEFVQEIWNGPGQLADGGFQSFPDGYFGYIIARAFPRDSKWIGIRVEQRPNQNAGGPWLKVADFKVKNPARPVIQPWVASAAAVSKSADGLDITVGDFTFESIPYMEHDIWNHRVTIPFDVRSNGVSLTNWAEVRMNIEDASGNWDYFASHRGLDPRFVWKLDAEFEPTTNFPAGNIVVIDFPDPTQPVTTNVMDVPVSISWDGNYLYGNIPTNRQDIALRFVNVTDDDGNTPYFPTGGGSQYSFRFGSLNMRKENGRLTMNFKPTKLTVAIIPHVSATFYAKPRYIPQKTDDVGN